MKWPLLTAVHWLFLVLISTAPAQEESGGPSRAETVEWLLGKLEGHAPSAYVTNDVAVWKQTEYTKISFDDDILQYTETLKLPNGSIWRQYSVKLKDLVPKIKISSNPLMTPVIYEVSFDSAKGKTKITESSGVSYGRGVGFEFTSEEMAQRVGNALEHLIKLAGGKSEPF